jgi:hypothetical protein
MVPAPAEWSLHCYRFQQHALIQEARKRSLFDQPGMVTRNRHRIECGNARQPMRERKSQR